MIKDEQNAVSPGRYDLFVLTNAYNRGEISLEEWMQRTKVWAEAVIVRNRCPVQTEPPVKPRSPD